MRRKTNKINEIDLLLVSPAYSYIPAICFLYDQRQIPTTDPRPVSRKRLRNEAHPCRRQVNTQRHREETALPEVYKQLRPFVYCDKRNAMWHDMAAQHERLTSWCRATQPHWADTIRRGFVMRCCDATVWASLSQLADPMAQFARPPTTVYEPISSNEGLRANDKKRHIRMNRHICTATCGHTYTCPACHALCAETGTAFLITMSTRVDAGLILLSRRTPYLSTAAHPGRA